MKKLNMETNNLADEKFQLLQENFPNAFTESKIIDDEGNEKIERVVNTEVLAQEINTHIIDGPKERYEFTWPDKKKSILLANSPIK